MASFHHLDDLRALEVKIEQKAEDLFEAQDGKSPLQVTRVFQERFGKGNKRERSRVSLDEDVEDLAQIKSLHDNENDSTQIFTITQDRSLTTINISQNVFERFMSIFRIMPVFWKYVFTFGIKNTENEFEFPGFGRRKSRLPGSEECKYEYAYMLRRVELKNRRLNEGESPWSIRQTAVYHSLTPKTQAIPSPKPGSPIRRRFSTGKKSTFLLIAPSPNAKWQLTQCLKRSTSGAADAVPLSPWNLHRILIADSLKGWGDYMANLELRLKEKTDPIILAEVGRNKESESPSPLLGFKINFEDRQELKIVENFVVDLQVILPSMLQSIVSIHRECKAYSETALLSHDEQYELEAILDEFGEYINETRMYADRAKALQAKAASTALLLSDLLSFEGAIALEDLGKDTKKESKAMCGLTERSTKDAAAVKILTVMTLIFLPTTIVANFFSTQFVQRNDAGQMYFVGDAWLLAAIGVPLTVVTIAVWWSWVYFTTVDPVVSREDPDVVVFQRTNSLKRVLTMSKKKQKQPDLEVGLPTATPPSPRSPVLTSAKTSWGSTTSTVKFG